MSAVRYDKIGRITTIFSFKRLVDNTLYLDTPIYCTIVANAQGYRWRVVKMINGVASTNPSDIQSIDTPLRTFRITQLTSYAFDTQYQVEVAVRVNNV